MFLAASVKNKNSNNSLQCITRWTRVNKVINWFRVLSGNLLNEGKTTAIIALALKYTHSPIYTICRYIWLGEKQQLQGDGRTRTLLWLKTKGNLAPKWQARKLYDFWLGFHVVGAVFGDDANWAQQKKKKRYQKTIPNWNYSRGRATCQKVKGTTNRTGSWKRLSVPWPYPECNLRWNLIWQKNFLLFRLTNNWNVESPTGSSINKLVDSWMKYPTHTHTHIHLWISLHT